MSPPSSPSGTDRMCVLDIKMPGNGITAAARIRARLPDCAVVMLTVSDDDQDLFAALRAGASGYLLKGMAYDRLPDILRAVLAGEAALPRALVGRMVEDFRSRATTAARRFPLLGKRADLLTEREWEVLEAMFDGLTTQEIAGRIRIAPVTVRTHVAAILRKLRVPDRESAVKLLEAGRPA